MSSKFSFQILGSSSAGNCAVLRSPRCTILIDAGFSGVKIKESLKNLGLSLNDIDAVFFTHEHDDHRRGASALARQANIQFLANRYTAEEIDRRCGKKFDWCFFETGAKFEFCDLRVKTFGILHDAFDPVGFVFECGESAGTTEKLAWLTDCGKITNVARHALADVDTLVIEANYDDKMLAESSRPPNLISRIRGMQGHLSNNDTANFLREYENDRLARVYFAHVSRECNDCDVVRRVCVPALGSSAAASVVDPRAMLPAESGWGF